MKTGKTRYNFTKINVGRASVFLGFAGPENNNTKAKIHLQAAIYLLPQVWKIQNRKKIERDYGIGLNMYPERLSSRPEDKTMMMVETTVSNGKSELLLKRFYIQQLTVYRKLRRQMMN